MRALLKLMAYLLKLNSSVLAFNHLFLVLPPSSLDPVYPLLIVSYTLVIIFRYDLSDVDDIVRATHNLVKKANLMLITFSAADPLVKSRLLQSFCLSLYDCSLWNCECPSIHSVEVSFNNILRRIWHLPRNCHTVAYYI